MRRLIFLLILISSIFIINNLVRSIYNLWTKQDLMVKAQKQLESRQKENKDLQKQLAEVKSQQFIESEARNKLFLVKPGERQIFIPEDLEKSSESAKTKEQKKANWEKWINLFF